MRPNEVARTAQKSGGSHKGGREKGAAIKVGRDSGRVKVFVRVRPLKPQELSRKEQVAVDVSELKSSIHVSDPKHSYEKDFPFDHVFPSESTNHEVCNTLCKPIVSSALNGFNGTLMAYGQTGSGKTYTLMAPDGIAAAVVDRCFKRIMQDSKHDYKVSMSYLQIYQEKIYDLLNSTNKVELTIREHPQKGVYVENLSEFVVRTPSEIMNLLAVGKKRLVFAETKMNRTSSRSHSVCMLLIERTLSKDEGSKPKDCVPNGVEKKSPTKESRANSLSRRTSSPKKTLASSSSNPDLCPSETEEEEQDSLAKMTFTDDVLVRGRIHLCDLAGSERLKKTHAEGERLSEAQHINLSLLELGNVIHALADGSKTHVPFRNSTLTRLLQESLGGNCKTSLIVCVSPTMTDVSETKSTLLFGSRAMKITNTAYVNVEVDYKKLSDDLTKMLNSREKDMEDLKEAFENRIEKVKIEAESQISSSMAAAQEALSSARNLYESKEQELKVELQHVDVELQREKHLSIQLQEQLSSFGGFLQGGVQRAKTALLSELLSMQLFYTLQDLPEEKRREIVNTLHEDNVNAGGNLLEVREKVLQNTDSVLQLFESYLKLLEQSGKDLENTGLNLKDLLPGKPLETSGIRALTFSNSDDKEIGTIQRDLDTGMDIDSDTLTSLSESAILSSDDLVSDSAHTALNQTDDAKVIESGMREQESNASTVFTLTKHLRDKLSTIKGSLDGNALCFLKKTFAIDKDVKGCEQVYTAMVEVLKQQEYEEGERSQDTPSIPVIEAEMALLDQSLCHVLVDKALQSSLLLLERTETLRHCDQLTENNNTLNKELEVMRLQVETLVSENTKLNSKLSETSNFLQDVKSSKEMLENDLSSVFQLYNMRTPEKRLSKGNSGNQDLKDGISSLVEENAKLKVELKDTQQEKRDLQIQLKNTKEQVEKFSKELELKSSIAFTSHSTQTDIASPSKETQTTLNDPADVSRGKESSTEKLPSGQTTDENEDENSQRKKSVSKKLIDIEQFLLKLQDELVKLEEDELGLLSHSKQKQAVSSLRLNLNKRLGELWSLEVVESKKLRARVDDLTTKLENSTNDYEKQIEDLEKELCVESEARLNLENELLQYRKEVMDLGAEIWTTRLQEDSSTNDTSSDLLINVTQHGSLTPLDDIDGTRRLSVNLYSISRCNSDDSLHENSKRRAELYIAEIDNKKAKEELQDLKQSFVQLNQDLADSGKERQEMEEKYVNLTNENKAITLKFEANEVKNRALEEKVIHVSAVKTTLQDELLTLKKKESSHLEEIRSYKEKIANFEVEKTKLKQDLSKTEIKYTTIDNKYQEINKELMETTKRLKEAQTKLKEREQELTDLHEAYDRLRSHIAHEDSDRESLVEVKMKPNNRRDSATPSRIQSIHLVSRAKAQNKKKQPTYPTAKKKMSMKRSPRNDELTRSNTIKRTGTIGKRGTLNSPRDSRTLTRGNSDRDTVKRAKGRTLKRDSEEDQKLKSELLLAKEQLIRLKGELTLSNIQTANLGTHLSSLREDSNKLEVELTSLRRSPGASKEDETSRTSKADKLLEMELDKAKEKIINLQDEMLLLRKEKTSFEEKTEESEKEVTQLRSELYKTRDGLERSQEVVKILNKEIELLETKNQILQQRLTSYTNEELQQLLAERDNSEVSYKLTQYEQDKARLEKEIEQLNSEKTKLEDMQSLVQQLVEVEDEQALLKNRLRNAVKQATKNDEVDENIGTLKKTETKTQPQMKKSTQRAVNELQQNAEKKLEEYYIENTALRCEVDALRIYIANLENENKAVKYKLSVSESMHGNKDKKVLATLLASAKHEREELRETLNSVYSEKEDIEEALNVSRVKSERLQRELHAVIFNRDDLEKELNSIKANVQTPEKESTSTSLSMDEKGVAELVKGFLCTIGSRNAKEKDIKEFAKTIIARKIQVSTKSGKLSSVDQRNPSWNKSSSMSRNGDSPVKANKTQVTGNRTRMQANTSPTKTTRTAGLRRSKPGTNRGTPEGMEEECQATSKTNKTKYNASTKSDSQPKSELVDETATSDKSDQKLQNGGHVEADKSVDFSSANKLYNQLQSASKDIKDDLSLIYLDLDHANADSPAENEVLIKRAWSLKDIFKRSTTNSKTATNPSYINQ